MLRFMNLSRFLAVWFGVIAILSISSASAFAEEKLAPAGSKQGPEISAQDASQNNWLLGVIFKLENMRDEAIADIQKYEGEIQKCDTTISKSENIVRLAQQKGNVQAEVIAKEALIKATEAKRENEILKQGAEKKKNKAELAKASVSATLAKQLKRPEESAAKNKTELILPPYFDEGAPPVDCNKVLKQLDNPNCKCLAANRAPVCPEKGMKLPNEEEKLYVFYWNIAFTREGKHYLNDGVYFGKYDSYDEAFKACQEDAKNGSQLDPTDHVLQLNCIPQ